MEENEDMMKRFLAEAKRKCLAIDGNNTAVDASTANNSNSNSKEMSGVLSELTSSGRCPREWDGFLCWPSSPASQSVHLRCPDMLYAFDTTQFASRTCGDNGTWTLVKVTPIGPLFTNYTMCTLATQDHIRTIEAFQPHIRTIKFLARIGYGVSLVSLICALVIIISIKRLRCPRNCLHMNLFTSFILRATIFLLKDRMFISGVGLYSTFDDNQESICCKLFLAMFHYTLMANYCWILMEGLYLHSLVFHSLGNDPSSISKYTIVGWGLPVLFIAPWSIARALWENKLCWTTNKVGWHEWIIRGPITLSIVVNFVLFVNITRVLFVKMFTSQTPMAKRYKYRKWFKSTLVLVPLFGSHYSLLLVASIAADLLSPQVEVYWMYIDQTFSSFQGALVALLYCFFNTEVNEAIRFVCRRNPHIIYMRKLLSSKREVKPGQDGAVRSRAMRQSRSMENSCERSDFFVHDHSSNPFARKLSTTSYTDAVLVHPVAAHAGPLPPLQGMVHGMHVHGLHVHAQPAGNNRLQVMPELHPLTTTEVSTRPARSCSPRDQASGAGPMPV